MGTMQPRAHIRTENLSFARIGEVEEEFVHEQLFFAVFAVFSFWKMV